MPGEEIKRCAVKACKEGFCPTLSVGNSRAAYLKARETLFKMCCRNFVKLKKFRLCASPTTLVGGVVIVKVGLVPDLPVFNIVMEAVCPAFCIMANDMLTNYCPLFEILRRQSSEFLNSVFNFRAEAIEGSNARILADLYIFVGCGEPI